MYGGSTIEKSLGTTGVTCLENLSILILDEE